MLEDGTFVDEYGAPCHWQHLLHLPNEIVLEINDFQRRSLTVLMPKVHQGTEDHQKSPKATKGPKSQCNRKILHLRQSIWSSNRWHTPPPF